jgi:hypothetical protein
MLTAFVKSQPREEERTMRIFVFLALFGFLAVAQPFGSQSMDVRSNDPVVKTDQAQFPPPPDCGLYDTCKG